MAIIGYGFHILPKDVLFSILLDLSLTNVSTYYPPLLQYVVWPLYHYCTPFLPSPPSQEREEEKKEAKKRRKNTCNSWDSLVVTHPTTNQPACGLSMAERTGSPVFHTLWSHVIDGSERKVYNLHKEAYVRGIKQNYNYVPNYDVQGR
jgi:hypothetical protein